jgi:hypothetical protein
MDFESEVAILRERQLVHFAKQCPHSFCREIEVLPGELWCEGDPCDLVPADFSLFPKLKIPSEEEDCRM